MFHDIVCSAFHSTLGQTITVKYNLECFEWASTKDFSFSTPRNHTYESRIKGAFVFHERSKEGWGTN